MSELFKEGFSSVSKLIEEIEGGEIGVPDIQRPFVWKNSKVRDLFDSMFRGFPVGYLLFWENERPEEQRFIGVDTKHRKIPRLLIVDGQQRLTSLYAVMKGVPIVTKDYQQRKIQIAFRPRDNTFKVADGATRRNPEFIPDISVLWEGGRRNFVNNFVARLINERNLSETDGDLLYEAIDTLYDLKKYRFNTIELIKSVKEEDVSEIFVRINSQGNTLNQADFILTLMSVFWDDGRKELEDFCRLSRTPQVEIGNIGSPHNYHIQPNPDELLRVIVGVGFRRAALRYVYSILRGKDLETGIFSEARRDKQFGILKTAQEITLDLTTWHDFFQVLKQAGYNRADVISSKNALLYTYVMYIIGKKEYKLDNYQLRNTIAKWFYMVTLTKRYANSPETVMERDLRDLRDISTSEGFVSHLTAIIQREFTSDFWSTTLPYALERSSARGPALFTYYAALNILGAKALFSQLKVSELLQEGLKSKKSPLDRHHLFPKAYLKKIGFKEPREYNQIANFALVEYSDNIKISDKPPSEYFLDYIARYKQDELENIYNWHCLWEGWESGDYRDFLEERRKRIAKFIKQGFEALP